MRSSWCSAWWSVRKPSYFLESLVSSLKSWNFLGSAGLASAGLAAAGLFGSSPTAGPPPEARLSGLISLGKGVAYRVESPGLAAIRAELAKAFAGLLTPQDQAGWRAHVTIQNKVALEVARALLSELQAGFTLEQRLRLLDGPGEGRSVVRYVADFMKDGFFQIGNSASRGK